MDRLSFPLDQKEGFSQDSFGVSGTTLLKPLPYDGIDKDESKEIEEIIESMPPIDPLDPVQTQCQDLLKLVGSYLGRSGLEVGPVLEVIYVAIGHKDDSNWKPLEIFGEISIVDDINNKPYYIYNKKLEDAEAVSPDNDAISISRSPIAPVMKGNVIFNLTDKTTGVQFKGDRTVEISHLDDWEIDEILTIEGEGGYNAEMLYTIMPFAQVAEVGSISLSGPAEPKFDNVKVEGHMRANGISFLENGEFKVADWSSEDETLYRVKKSRDVFAIPAYSCLVVEILLHRDGVEFINQDRESNPYGVRISDGLGFDCKDGKHCFSVYVSWKCPSEYFDLCPWFNEPVMSKEYVEVFSIYFGGGDSTPIVCGTIVVRDPKETVYIFSRTCEYPDILSTSKLFRRTISLAWPDWWVQEKDFFMHLKLKDKHGNRVCRGSLGFSDDSASYPTRLDRRICAVIRGEKGHFVAVHYSIFRNGLRATVTVVCEGPGNSSFGVYGSVYAEYGNHDYSSMYDQNYYRVIIFNRPEEYRAKVENYSEIPLSKSKITTPSDCGHIVIYVDLTFRPNMASSSDMYAIGNHQFKADEVGIEHIPICGPQSRMHLGCVTVKVEWNP